MPSRLLFAVCVAAALTTACIEVTNKYTGPSAASLSGTSGTWQSVSSPSQLQNACTNFKWQITTSTATSASGTFSATCFGTLNVTGSAQGTLSGSTITWSATAVGTAGSILSCAASLAGTATLSATQIAINYSGTTCLGPVSGTEVLSR